MPVRSCVSPEGRFRYGVHRPNFRVDNLRAEAHPTVLGETDAGAPVDNRANFPDGDVPVPNDDWVYEVPNPFPFRGTTYIAKRFADAASGDPGAIALGPPPEVSFRQALAPWLEQRRLPPEALDTLLARMPEPLLLALATCGTDAADLERLAECSCRFLHDPHTGRPVGLAYRETDRDRQSPDISRHALFKATANNPHLPDDYKKAMVLRPGAQGGSEIVGEWGSSGGGTHVFEYMRRNSYIPWGHYAANMADDAVRYRLEALSAADMQGLRHLYYQRTFVRLAAAAGWTAAHPHDGPLSAEALESLRLWVRKRWAESGGDAGRFTATLWGWNFGFDYAPSGHRMHGSHQQIHQQYALIPRETGARDDPDAGIGAFAFGDLVGDFAEAFQRRHGRSFFDAYIEAVRSNRRMSGTAGGDDSLVVYEDPRVMVFVPKAQTSQWELQLMPLAPVGNVLEADAPTRASLDRAMLVAVRVLSALGARMITSVEASKRFDRTDSDQRLLYCFLPRLPESPGAFSEAQLRWINRHYPEDFAAACRDRVPEVLAAVAKEVG